MASGTTSDEPRARRAATLGALVAALTALGATLAMATAASAAGPTITVSPSTGLSNGTSVSVTGSGFKASQPGNVLECNAAPNEPTVQLGSPVNSPVPVGCTAPSLSAASLTSTSASGTMSKSFPVVQGTVGPPCGTTNAVITVCPSTDSAGQDPKTDAANYPCPPTPAQQAAGVTCTLTFGDESGESASATILFAGESAPTSTTAPTTPSTTTATTPTTIGASATTAPPTSSSGGSLAYTGPGPQLWVTALVAVAFVLLAGLLRLTARRAWRR